MKKIILASITAVVIITMLATVLVPIVEDAQTNLGDPITKTNSVVSPLADYSLDDFTVTASAANDSDGYAYYINGVGYEKVDATRHMIITDVFCFDASSSSGRTAEVKYWGDSGYYAVNVTADVTIEYDATDKTLTYTVSGSDAVVFDVIYAFTWADDGPYGTIISTANYPNMYLTMDSVEDESLGVFIVSGRNVEIGETTVSYIITASKYGVIANFSDDGYTATVEVKNLTLADGTTDIYTGGTPYIIISDGDGNTIEEVPSRSYLLTEVNGHASSGASYSLLGAIPIMVIVALLLGVVALVIRSRMN